MIEKQLKKRSEFLLRDVILGGQDGLVNVLGLTLGLGAAHSSIRIIVIAGLAAGFSEAVSMGAVSYTSSSADEERIRLESVGQRLYSAFVVVFSALLGALLPLVPFLFFDVRNSLIVAVILAALVLFYLGFLTAEKVGGSRGRSGVQVALIGLVSAFFGFIIGLLLGVIT